MKQSFLSYDFVRFWSLGYPRLRELGCQGNTSVKNVPQVGVEVCTKFGGDWSYGSRVKEGHRYKQSLL